MSTSKPAFQSGVRGNPYRIRDPLASSLVEVWLIAAVVTVLGIRAYLALTGYPQVGGDTLHIAHMLWGGLGMVIGFGMLILFANSVWKPIATLVAGAGFGAFIDELGKFITRDNDYFYQPTVALIYIIFVVLFLLAKLIERRRQTTEADHLFLASQGIQWLAIGKLDHERQQIALKHLDESGNTSPIAHWMRDALTNAELVAYSEQSRVLAWRQELVSGYWWLVSHHWIERIVVGLFIVRAVQILGSLAFGLSHEFYDFRELTFVESGALVSATVSGVLALYGVVRMFQHHRVASLHAFAGSTLFSLLFGQFFAFASNQFAAFGNLVLELVILGVLRLAIAAEDTEHHEETDRASAVDPRSGVGRLF